MSAQQPEALQTTLAYLAVYFIVILLEFFLATAVRAPEAHRFLLINSELWQSISTYKQALHWALPQLLHNPRYAQRTSVHSA